MQLDPDGAQLHPRAFTPAEIDILESLLGDALQGRPGARLQPVAGMADAIRPATRIASDVLGPPTRPVRAMLFDKNPGQNWALGWHQDRTIAVRERRDTPGFTDWTVKHGIHHTVPPFEILAHMLTARIHLDPVGADNAPLIVAPGSHAFDRIDEARIEAISPTLARETCLAARGDVWLYSTPILHASDRATAPCGRRVLQILYSAEDLPAGLDWLGV
jgi:ectoine hydroxylase-related dioxygenase (phytanoyl-CoA dioxygenase family)